MHTTRGEQFLFTWMWTCSGSVQSPLSSHSTCSGRWGDGLDRNLTILGSIQRSRIFFFRHLGIFFIRRLSIGFIIRWNVVSIRCSWNVALIRHLWIWICDLWIWICDLRRRDRTGGPLSPGRNSRRFGSRRRSRSRRTFVLVLLTLNSFRSFKWIVSRVAKEIIGDVVKWIICGLIKWSICRVVTDGSGGIRVRCLRFRSCLEPWGRVGTWGWLRYRDWISTSGIVFVSLIADLNLEGDKLIRVKDLFSWLFCRANRQ